MDWEAIFGRAKKMALEVSGYSSEGAVVNVPTSPAGAAVLLSRKVVESQQEITTQIKERVKEGEDHLDEFVRQAEKQAANSDSPTQNQETNAGLTGEKPPRTDLEPGAYLSILA